MGSNIGLHQGVLENKEIISLLDKRELFCANFASLSKLKLGILSNMGAVMFAIVIVCSILRVFRIISLY